MTDTKLDRREFGVRLAGALAATAVPSFAAAAADTRFALKYIVASCMYGKAALAEILPEVPRCGAEFIEIWAERHGNQREQIETLGEDRVREMLDEHDVKLGSFTCFKLDRKSTRLNSSHTDISRMPSSA